MGPRLSDQAVYRGTTGRWLIDNRNGACRSGMEAPTRFTTSSLGPRVAAAGTGELAGSLHEDTSATHEGSTLGACHLPIPSPGKCFRHMGLGDTDIHGDPWPPASLVPPRGYLSLQSPPRMAPPAPGLPRSLARSAPPAPRLQAQCPSLSRAAPFPEVPSPSRSHLTKKQKYPQLSSLLDNKL